MLTGSAGCEVFDNFAFGQKTELQKYSEGLRILEQLGLDLLMMICGGMQTQGECEACHSGWSRCHDKGGSICTAKK